MADDSLPPDPSQVIPPQSMPDLGPVSTPAPVLAGSPGSPQYAAAQNRPPVPAPILEQLISGLVKPRMIASAPGQEARPVSRLDTFENFLGNFVSALGQGLSAAHGPGAAMKGAGAAIGAPYQQAVGQWQFGQEAQTRQLQNQQAQQQIGAFPQELAWKQAQMTAQTRFGQNGEYLGTMNDAQYQAYLRGPGAKTARYMNVPNVGLVDLQSPGGPKVVAQASGNKPDSIEQQYVDDFQRRNPKATFGDAVRAYTLTTQKPETSGAGDARLDRSYQFNSTQLEKVGQPLDQLSQRMGRLQDALAQGTPQADALIAPELLSVMAGGAGSGLRMNEAEISRIVGGRSNWEGLKAAANKWSTDPSTANSITPAQRQQIRALVNEVQGKLQRKQTILDAGRQQLIGASSETQHRSVVASTRRQLDAVDGAPASGFPRTTATHPFFAKFGGRSD